MKQNCNMKGFLEFQVLALIGKNNMCGTEIRKELSIRRGSMPSPGTVYPVLKYLQNKKLISIKETSNKEKKYMLTKKGNIELKKSKDLFKTMFKDLL